MCVGQGPSSVLPETPFTFHILPLRPFEAWTATNWPCECATNIIATGADPNADGTAILLEYAFGTDPHIALRTNLPAFSFVMNDGTNLGGPCGVVVAESAAVQPGEVVVVLAHSALDAAAVTGPAERGDRHITKL